MTEALDVIAEPRPDMNIKVAAFIVSEKSINTVVKQRQRLSTQIQSELKKIMFSHGEASQSQAWYLIVSIPDICLLYFDA